MKIALLGDVAFYGKFCIKQGKPKEYFHKTAEILKTFDYVVLNLETPFANINAKKFGSKSAYISSIPENIELLKYLGVNAVCLANNHMFDFGYEAYTLTKKLLNDNDIGFFGVENRDLKINISGNKIAFSGYCCYSTNPINANKNGVNPLDVEVVLNKLTEDKSKGFASILSIHAGQEHVNYPNSDHMDMAKKLSETHSFVYYGHHPHVLQGIEHVNDSLLAYSLGNFCFDDVYTEKSKEPLVKMNNNNKESAILSLEFLNSKLMGHELIPLYDAQVCDGIQKEKILVKISEYSARLQDEKDAYDEKRAQLLNLYLQNRKSKRDLNWYLKRMNYNSLKMIINSYSNIQKYKYAIKKHL